MYLTHFSTVFHVFGLVLEGKPVRVTGKGSYGSGYGYTPRYPRVTRAFAYVLVKAIAERGIYEFLFLDWS
jgi:hypothetical protein